MTNPKNQQTNYIQREASVAATNSGGLGTWRSRGRREAIRKPLSQHWPVTEFTGTSRLTGRRAKRREDFSTRPPKKYAES
jgi:hypothetical protein